MARLSTRFSLALVAVLAVSLVACSPTVDIPDESPAPTESATPTATGPELTIANLRLPAGLPDDDLGALVMERLTQWHNAGADDDLQIDRLNANKNWEDFLPTVAESNRKLFGGALLISSWQQDANLTDFAQQEYTINLGTLLNFTASEWNGDERPENVDGYERYVESSGVTSGSTADGDRVLHIAYLESDNSALNYVPDDLLANSGPIAGTYHFAFRTVDGAEKIVSWSLTTP